MAARNVLIVRPAREFLVESATMLFESKTQKVSAAAADFSDGKLKLDKDFPAIPLGRAAKPPPALNLKSLEALTPAAAQAANFAFAATYGDPAQSEKFMVRGKVDDSDIAAVRRKAEAEGGALYADSRIGVGLMRTARTQMREPPHFDPDGPIGDAAAVAQKLGVASLAAKGLTGAGIGLAILDTGINVAHLARKLGFTPKLDTANSFTPASARPARPGRWPVNHGTMCAYDALIAAPKATLLDHAVLLSRRAGRSSMDGLLSDAMASFSALLNLLKGPGARPYERIVVNNSWGMFQEAWDLPQGDPGRYADNPNHPFNLQVGALTRAGADVLFAAGNCGVEGPDSRCDDWACTCINGANSHPEALSIAGVLTDTRRVAYSSKGPGLLSRQKPDIAAYTHFLGSESFGTGTSDSGTSAACPVAAGVIAAIRTKVTTRKVPPSKMAGIIRSTARQPAGVAAGWNKSTGFGVIDAVAAAAMARGSASPSASTKPKARKKAKAVAAASRAAPRKRSGRKGGR